MSNEINGVSPAGTFQYNPYCCVGFDDLDMNFSTYPMVGTGMCGSIFDGGYGMGMGMMPFAPGIGFGNNSSYFNNMKDYQKFYIDYNVDQQKMSRNADLRINASLERIKGAASVLKDKIVNNEQSQVEQAYRNYVSAVAAAYGQGSKEEIEARAKSLYTQMNGGKTLTEDLRQYGHSSFTQGFLQSMAFSTVYRKSAEDNISKITGAPVGTEEKAKQNAGRLTGAAAIGAAAGGVAKACKSGKAGIIGLVAAGIAAALSFATGKVTT